LQSLNNESAVNPSVFSPYFENLGVKNYWSSTTLKPNPQNPNSAWYFGTQYGITTYDVKTNTNYVICVKGNPTLSVKQEKIDSLIQVFPNPFKSTINLKSYSGNENYELYSSFGKLIYTGPTIEKQDFSALTNGVYFLRIKDKSTTTIKLIKE